MIYFGCNQFHVEIETAPFHLGLKFLIFIPPHGRFGTWDEIFRFPTRILCTQQHFERLSVVFYLSPDFPKRYAKKA